MYLSSCWRRLILLWTMTAAAPVSASEALKLLPADADLVVTLNVKQLREDHKNTEFIREMLEPWRLALQGDEKKLRKYHKAHQLLEQAGISEKSFLDRARLVRSFSDSLGVNPLEDVDRVTFAIRKDDWASWVVLVEGRFKKAPPRPAHKILVALVRPTVLVLSGRKKEMDELHKLAAGPRRDPLAPGMRILLEKAEREHLALCVDRVDALLKDAAKLTLDQTAKVLGLEDSSSLKRLLDQAAKWFVPIGEDIACAGLGLSIRADESRLQAGLIFKKPEKAKALADRINRDRLLAGLALQVIDRKLTRQLGDILLGANVTRTRETVLLRARVPHEFLEEAANELLTTLYPMVDHLSRQLTSIPIWGLPKPPPGALEVEERRDIAYRDGEAADPIRHRLDLFRPRGKKDCPVVVLVHGGGWIMGDNRCCGLYSSVGHFLAGQGFVVVLPNYRLSPKVMHPEHVKDVARALRWTHDHIAEYGGSPDRMFLMGHSAGGHLVALLGTDESYAKAEGLSFRNIKGVIAISGVYRITPGILKGFLGGEGIRCLRPDELLPLRGEANLPVLPALGLPLALDVFGPAFGTDPKLRRAASPVCHVGRVHPPFLILIAEKDLPTQPGTAEEFHRTLRRAGCAAQLLKVPHRNHSSLLFSAITPDDPAARAMLEFLRRTPAAAP